MHSCSVTVGLGLTKEPRIVGKKLAQHSNPPSPLAHNGLHRRCDFSQQQESFVPSGKALEVFISTELRVVVHDHRVVVVTKANEHADM